jgi:protein O-mannosyl-transferase
MKRLNENYRCALICVLLASVTLGAFWPVLSNDFIKLDDRQYVVENPHVVSGLTWGNVRWAFQAGYASNWHPLTWLSHMVDVQLFGLKPGWHHLVNLVLHIANTLLLFLVLQRMTGARWRGAFVAALFAVHPLHVESVGWVSERKDVLSAFFFMLTLWAYCRYAQLSRTSNIQRPTSNIEPGKKARGAWRAAVGASSPRPSPPDEERERTGRARLYYGLALAFFALGLMSKPMLVTLPFVLLLLDFWPLGRSTEFGMRDAESAKAGSGSARVRCWAGLVAEKAPFFLLAALSSVATFLAQAKGHNVSTGLPLGSRAANAVASYWKYLGKTVWPADLAVFYPHPDIRYPLSHQWDGWAIGLAALLLAAISAAAVFCLKRQPWFATGWFWYFGTLVPVIGLVQVGGQGMADRYTYIPLVGVFICVVWGAADLCAGWRLGRAGLATAAVLIVAACMVATQQQVRYWRSNLTLFEHALAVTTDNAVAEYHVGTEFEEQHKYEEAMAHFRAALKYDPSYVDAYCSLGFTLYAVGKVDEAFEQYQTAIKLKPWHAQARVSLGAILWMRGQRNEAMEQYAEALRLRPDLAMAHYNMGIALSASGRLSAAAAHLSEAVRLKPDYPEARRLLTEVLAKQRKLDRN